MAMRLLGKFQYSLDEKNRVRIPAKFRQAFADNLVLMPSLFGPLYLLPDEKANPELDKLSETDLYDIEGQRKASMVMSYTDEIKIDNQGRILLDNDWRKIGKIAKDVVFVGKGAYVELWSKEEWDLKFNLLNKENIDAVLEKMKAYGI